MSASARTPAGRAGCRGRSALGERGATSLEFALVGALLLTLLLGSIELGRYMFTLESVRTATAEAVRLVTLRGSQNLNAGRAACTDLSGDLAGAGAHTPFLQTSLLSVEMSNCLTQAGITTVTVTLKYQFTFTVPLFGARSRTMTDTTQAVFN